MFFPAVKKGTLKCGKNQDEKSRESGEFFYNYLTYLFLMQNKRINYNEKSIRYKRIRQMGMGRDKNLYLFKINPRINQRIADVADQF